jgi:hypothetical protein
MSIVKCTFTSIWDDGSEIVTPANFDTKTGEVFADFADVDPNGSLEEEFITINKGADDEDEKEVCPVCHSYIMKTVMNPGIGHDLNEEEQCSDPDCESNN